MPGEQVVRARVLAAHDVPRSPVPKPGDESSAWLLGTGTPNCLADRSGPANLVLVGDEAVLVDCGNGTARQLAKLGVQLADVSTIFITHHHIDHNADLAFLLLSPWITKTLESAPLIVGPPGTVEHVDRVLRAHEYDLRVRMPHGFDPADVAPPVVEVEDTVDIDRGGWRARAIRVDHAPVDQAFGYRFEIPAGSVVFSGDTRPCDNLVAQARGADVLVHEVLMPGWGIPAYHTPVDRVGDIATRAGVDRLVLTHLIPGTLDDSAWLDKVRPDFPGDLIVGRDLMQVL